MQGSRLKLLDVVESFFADLWITSEMLIMTQTTILISLFIQFIVS